MNRKTLIITIDMQGGADWQIKALQRQMADWLETNKTLKSFEDLIILPATGETRLYWLEGDDTPENISSLEEIKARLKPVLEVALDIKIDKEGLYKRPNKKFDEAFKHLHTKRTSLNVGPRQGPKPPKFFLP